ncbi:hypothetical protein BX600DRAFT_204119 [Xylariales sp. PMI_506]|nr:hypothetical protein BX600DRAFT_204119 [Xylariales sp. PMI_506]
MAPTSAQPSLTDLGHKLLSEGPVKTLRTPKRIRIHFNGCCIADTTSAIYVWEHPWYPYYYVPLTAFAPGVLEGVADEGAFGIVRLCVGNRSTDRVLAFGPRTESGDGSGSVNNHATSTTTITGSNNSSSSSSSEELIGMVRVEFSAADAWFEEDERIYVHPKDPFRRIEILHSSRPVRVLVDGGREIARASSSWHLYETGLPVRYYLPAGSVDPAVLRPSDTSTQCPYKGVASYYDVVLAPGQNRDEELAAAQSEELEAGVGPLEPSVLKDLVWYYRTPTLESAQIAGALCFYNEKVDIELDGEMLERPRTHFA